MALPIVLVIGTVHQIFLILSKHLLCPMSLDVTFSVRSLEANAEMTPPSVRAKMSRVPFLIHVALIALYLGAMCSSTKI